MEYGAIAFDMVMIYGLPFVALFAAGFIFLEFLKGRKR